MSKILLITDSRGVELESMLREIICEGSLNIDIKVLAVRGANILSVEDEAIKEMIGINNLTEFWGYKQVIFSYDNIPDLVNDMDNMYTHLKYKLQKYAPKVCHLIGLDILAYNLSKTHHAPLIIADYPGMQNIINGSIAYINRAIDSMNTASNVQGPWLEDTIHTSIKGKKINKYLRLHDGLHPDNITKKLWAKKLTKAFLDNMN